VLCRRREGPWLSPCIARPNRQPEGPIEQVGTTQFVGSGSLGRVTDFDTFTPLRTHWKSSAP
jgi:hypothetical protein